MVHASFTADYRKNSMNLHKFEVLSESTITDNQLGIWHTSTLTLYVVFLIFKFSIDGKICNIAWLNINNVMW